MKETKEHFTTLSGFDLPRPFETATDIAHRHSVPGPIGTLFQKEDGLWYWMVQSGIGKDRDRAKREMRAAIDGGSVIGGLDGRGCAVQRRRDKGYDPPPEV